MDSAIEYFRNILKLLMIFTWFLIFLINKIYFPEYIISLLTFWKVVVNQIRKILFVNLVKLFLSFDIKPIV